LQGGLRQSTENFYHPDQQAGYQQLLSTIAGPAAKYGFKSYFGQ
jgi:hypothetical protein